MNTLGNNIISSKYDDDLLTEVTKSVSEHIRNEYICQLPDTWDIECGSKKIVFSDIIDRFILNGIPKYKAEEYYGGPSSIETDSHVIYLTINFSTYVLKYPLFMGEMKKQGTNDKRIAEGKGKQAIGNAAGDRVSKNYCIASDYCYACDKKFFPYNVFMHGCDFDEDTMTSTMKAKLQPFFGELNKLNPFFDQDMIIALSKKSGGSCFYQKEEYTYEKLFKICYECCKIGIEYYLSKNF